MLESRCLEMQSQPGVIAWTKCGSIKSEGWSCIQSHGVVEGWNSTRVNSSGLMGSSSMGLSVQMTFVSVDRAH